MQFNESREPDSIEPSQIDVTLQDIAEESLVAYRDPQTGLVGVNVAIRPYEDDHLLAFGDPNYCFQKKMIIQLGIDREN